jgi:hypothetical protein
VAEEQRGQLSLLAGDKLTTIDPDDADALWNLIDIHRHLLERGQELPAQHCEDRTRLAFPQRPALPQTLRGRKECY